jgi:Beta-eliminating lyase
VRLLPRLWLASEINTSSPVKLLCVENTHNIGGGSIWPLEQMEAVAATARRHGISVHLDGARLWHATAKTDIPEAQYAAAFENGELLKIVHARYNHSRADKSPQNRLPDEVTQGAAAHAKMKPR